MELSIVNCSVQGTREVGANCVDAGLGGGGMEVTIGRRFLRPFSRWWHHHLQVVVKNDKKKQAEVGNIDNSPPPPDRRKCNAKRQVR